MFRLKVPWNFDVSRRGLRLRSQERPSFVPGKTWHDAPGRPARKKRVVMVARVATKLDCRRKVLGNKECKWLLRATRSSDGVRNPSSQRQPVRTTARHLARGSPSIDKSVDHWPGAKETRRSAIARPQGEPRA